MGMRLQTVLKMGENIRTRIKVEYSGGGIWVWLDNKKIIDEWRVIEKINEIESIEVMLLKERGY